LSTEQHPQQFLALLDEFADVHVTPDFKPKRLKAYTVSEVLKPEVARQIQELLDLGFIKPSNCEMASPTVCVLKGQSGENNGTEVP